MSIQPPERRLVTEATLPDRVDQALTDPDSPAHATLLGTIGTEVDRAVEDLEVSGLSSLLGKRLDIWDEMTTPQTYVELIALCDSTLAGATKDARGTDANGTTVYSYTAGSGVMPVLILSGTHGGEQAAGATGYRWFERFMHDPAMQSLRDTLTVTWVPCLTPWAKDNSERRNVNMVDINRNFPFYFDRYAPAGSHDGKGAAAFSEAESQIAKIIVDAVRPGLTIDIHSLSSADYMTYAAPSPWVAGNRGVIRRAADITRRMFPTYTLGIEGPDLDPFPTVHNWAAYYCRWVLGIRDATSILIETPGGFEGQSQWFMPRTVAQYVGQHITNTVTSWLLDGKPEPATPLEWFARRSTYDPTVNVGAGGSALPRFHNGNITWTQITPARGSLQDYVDVILPAPGTLTIVASGWLISGGSASTDEPAVAEQVQAAIWVDGASSGDAGSAFIDMPLWDGGRAPFNAMHRIVRTSAAGFPDAASVFRVQLKFAHFSPGTGSRTHYVKVASMSITFTPEGDENPPPLVQ